MKRNVLCVLVIACLGIQPLCRANGDDVDTALVKAMKKLQKDKELESKVHAATGAVLISLSLVAAHKAIDSERVYAQQVSQNELLRQALRSSRMGKLLTFMFVVPSVTAFRECYTAHRFASGLNNVIERSVEESKHQAEKKKTLLTELILEPDTNPVAEEENKPLVELAKEVRITDDEQIQGENKSTESVDKA